METEVTSNDEKNADVEMVDKWVKSCLVKFYKNIISMDDFFSYWAIWVPKLYEKILSKPSLPEMNNEKIGTILIQSLEKFLCSEGSVEQLSAYGKISKLSSSICGRIFKFDEPTYYCKDCAIDATCVLCFNCFSNSEHKFHNYRISNSSNGGCCDCGDMEAWRSNVHCDVHIKGLKKKENSEKESLPVDFVRRLQLVFESIISYAFDLLATEHVVLPAKYSLNKKMPSEYIDENVVYCLVLFNDEQHTFEQVIHTISHVLDCGLRTAYDFVNNIDREGRCVVKCSTYHICDNLRKEINQYFIQNGNKPIKVSIISSSVIAHQNFALKLLYWLSNILNYGKEFRSTFVKATVLPNGNNYIGLILVNDNHMWKSARTHFHRVFIAGLLKEYEYKKLFGEIFVKNYLSIMYGFLQDDHDQLFSVTSLTVQLFTIPSLAQHLIAEKNALMIFLQCYYEAFETRIKKGTNKYEFERSTTHFDKKRAYTILSDIKYILKFTPKVWTNTLRDSFLNGFQIFLNILISIQGMNSFTRQLGEHVDYEQDWESSFNFYKRLIKVIQYIINWCASDKKVLIRAYREVVTTIQNITPSQWRNKIIIANIAEYYSRSISFDVSISPVSFHAPLNRLFAGLYSHLSTHELHFSSEELSINDDFFLTILMEPVIQLYAVMSQIHAGYWKRNGFSVVNQSLYYRLPKFRSEMIDRDIILLQFCANLMESNEFMLHILNRFAILPWISEEFPANFQKDALAHLFSSDPDAFKSVHDVVEEFLKLMIIIIGERYMYGVADIPKKESLKKELIQQLCVRPLTHSEFVKIFIEDYHEDVDFDELVQEVATFEIPKKGPNRRGVYTLKPEFYDEFNVFYYHYLNEDFSKADLRQRERRRKAGQSNCCPPPKLPKLMKNFEMLPNLLQCDTMLIIMQTVISRAFDSKEGYSDLQLHMVLHLIGYGLFEEQTGHYSYLNFIEAAEGYNIFKMLEKIVSSSQLENKDLVIWTLNKFHEVKSQLCKNNENLVAEVRTIPDKNESDKSKAKAKMAAASREKIMAEFKAIQQKFLNDNSNLFSEQESKDEKLNIENEKKSNDFPIALGPKKSPSLMADQELHCLICQENQNLETSSSPMVFLTFIQKSTVLSRFRKCQNETYELDHPNILTNIMQCVPFMSTCGHSMHTTCWNKYMDNLAYKESRRPLRLKHTASFTIEKNEFICPLCLTLCNTAIPVIPPIKAFDANELVPIPSFMEWFNIMKQYINDFKEATYNPEWVASTGDAYQLFPIMLLNHNLVNHVYRFALSVFEINFGKSVIDKKVPDSRYATLIWKICAYSVQNIEVALRSVNKPLMGEWTNREKEGLKSMVQLARVIAPTLFILNRSSLHVKGKEVPLVYENLLILLEGKNNLVSVMECDSFGLLVSTYFLMDIFLNISLNDNWILKMIFVKHIVQILITVDIPMLAECDMDQKADDLYMQSIIKILKMMKKMDDLALINLIQLKEILKIQSRPFLRSVSLFYKFLHNIAIPEDFLYVDGDTYENLCQFLGLESEFDLLIDHEELFDCITKWLNHDFVRNYMKKTEHAIRGLIPSDLTKIKRLTELPDDYMDLINLVSSFPCPNSDREFSRNPTMCLICGEILCSQSYCCQTMLDNTNQLVGACTFHNSKCTAGSGLFLRIRDCELLILSNVIRGCTAAPPYLDKYGEPDQGLLRGRPLKFCQEDYDRINLMWLNNRLHEEVTHFIEKSTTYSSIQWHTF